jgi:hypothetical protein
VIYILNRLSIEMNSERAFRIELDTRVCDEDIDRLIVERPGQLKRLKRLISPHIRSLV